MLTYEQKVDAIIEYLKWRDDKFAKYLEETEHTPRLEKTTDLDLVIRHVLFNADIRPGLSGFETLVVAMKLIIEDPSYTKCVSKRLYPEVAKIRGSTVKAVSSSIRHSCRSLGSNKEAFAILAMRIRYIMKNGGVEVCDLEI